jgi:TolB protein
LNGKIVFVIGGDYEQELYSINPDGSGIHRLTPADGIPDDHPVWSPDGRRIAWIHDEQLLYVGDADGLDARPVGQPVEDVAPAWSPDGRSLYEVGERATDNFRTHTVYRLDVQRGRTTELTPAGKSDAYAFGEPFGLASVPDGSLLILSSVSPCAGISHGVFSTCNAVLHVAADGRLLQMLWLYDGLLDYDSASPAPAGDAFATGVISRGDHQSTTGEQLTLLGLDGVARTLVTRPVAQTYDFDPAFSPDGRQIVFGRDVEDDQLRSLASDLYVIPSTGGQPRPLTHTPGTFESVPSWQAQPSALGHADLTPPVVHLRTQTVRAGRLARLAFRVSDAGTGRSRARGAVYDGKRSVASWLGSGFTNSSGGGAHLWHVPLRLAGRTLRYCTSASDWYGNLSRDVCVSLRVR